MMLPAQQLGAVVDHRSLLAAVSSIDVWSRSLAADGSPSALWRARAGFHIGACPARRRAGSRARARLRVLKVNSRSMLVVEAAGRGRSRPSLLEALEGRSSSATSKRLPVIADVDLIGHGRCPRVGNAFGLQRSARVWRPSRRACRSASSVCRATRAARSCAPSRCASAWWRRHRRTSTPGEPAGDGRPAAHQPRDRIDVQRPGAAEAHQREVARVVALLDRDHPQRAEHVLVDDVDDALAPPPSGRCRARRRSSAPPSWPPSRSSLKVPPSSASGR